jgi:hypothetical protein
MTTRLNASIREHIMRKALEHAFTKRRAELDKRQARWGAAVYRECMTPTGLKMVKRMPENWLVMTSSMRVEFAGEREMVTIAHGDKTLPVPGTWAPNAYAYSKPPRIPASHPLNEERLLLSRDEQAIHDDKQRVRGNLHALLMAHSTLESLIKNWPECKKFCPPAPAQVTALALPVAELNKMLGLT